MKARIVFVSFLITIAGISFSQKLTDLYKKDIIQLEPQNEFAQGNKWAELFKDYNAVGYGRNLGQKKKIVIAPDGSIFMSHKTVYEIWKFDNTGRFVKKFGSKGSKPGQFIYQPSVVGILDGKYLITSDIDGRLNFFDLEGNFVKKLKLDYIPDAIAPLKNNKIAILGYVPWKEEESKIILRIKDINTGVEKEIWNEIRSKEVNKSIIRINYPNGGAMGCSLPYSNLMLLNYRLATSKDGNLITVSPKNGEVKVYDTEGSLIKSFPLNITPVKITEEDINLQYNHAVIQGDDFAKGIENDKRMKLTDVQKKGIIDSYKKQVENYKNPKFYPKHLPYFSSIVVDSDGNLLVFEFTKDEDKVSNKFLAYSYNLKGDLLGTSSFKCDKFNLSFTAGTFQFYNGFVYVVANNPDGPPQIAKLKLQ